MKISLLVLSAICLSACATIPHATRAVAAAPDVDSAYKRSYAMMPMAQLKFSKVYYRPTNDGHVDIYGDTNMELEGCSKPENIVVLVSPAPDRSKVSFTVAFATDGTPGVLAGGLRCNHESPPVEVSVHIAHFFIRDGTGVEVNGQAASLETQ